jgi:hypothetical protein
MANWPDRQPNRADAHPPRTEIGQRQPLRVGYYSVFRHAVAAAEAWRTSMTSADQGAVRSVASASPLARFWPDLVTTG